MRFILTHNLLKKCGPIITEEIPFNLNMFYFCKPFSAIDNYKNTLEI